MENNNFTTPAPEDIPIRDPEVAAPEKQKKPLPPGNGGRRRQETPAEIYSDRRSRPCGGHRCGRDPPEPQQSVLRGQALCAGLLHR